MESQNLCLLPGQAPELPVLPEDATVAGLATNFISFKEQFCAFAFYSVTDLLFFNSRLLRFNFYFNTAREV